MYKNVTLKNSNKNIYIYLTYKISHYSAISFHTKQQLYALRKLNKNEHLLEIVVKITFTKHSNLPISSVKKISQWYPSKRKPWKNIYLNCNARWNIKLPSSKNCRANQLTGFYMVAESTFYELKLNSWSHRLVWRKVAMNEESRDSS